MTSRVSRPARRLLCSCLTVATGGTAYGAPAQAATGGPTAATTSHTPAVGSRPAAGRIPGYGVTTDAGYVFTIRSAAVETWARIPRETDQDFGFSYVNLEHDLEQPTGRCETFGAAYWLGEEIEEGVLGPGAAPSDAGNVSGGYRNPFVSRDVAPNTSVGQNLSDRTPGLNNYFPPGQTLLPLSPGGPGYKWSAKCDDDTHGSGQGYDADAAGFQAVASSSTAGVDRATGTYVGTSRSYALGTGEVAGFDSTSSFLQVTQSPGKPPLISYRMSFFNAGDSTGTNGITFGGQGIPVQQFADSFDEQARTAAGSLTGFGPAGAATLQPEVGVSSAGGRWSITISTAHGNAGLTAREGTIGDDQGIRIGSITFQGLQAPAH